MANITTIAQGKIIQKSMAQIFGIEPIMSIGENTVRIYYEPDKLLIVQKKLEIMMTKKSDLQIDFLPIFLPYIIKNSALPLMAVFGAGLYLGGK